MMGFNAQRDCFGATPYQMTKGNNSWVSSRVSDELGYLTIWFLEVFQSFDIEALGFDLTFGL
jgi:hypothetical protein